MIAIMLLAAGAISLDFSGKIYQRPKSWLHEQPDKRKTERNVE